MSAPSAALPWHRREDSWAIAVALGLVLAATLAFLGGFGRAVSATALTFPTWGTAGKVAHALSSAPAAPLALLGVFLVAFSLAARALGWGVARYAAGFATLFALSVLVTALGSNAVV